MQKLEDFSVLMSIYIKEKPEYLDACLDSLVKQTLCAREWVIVNDGPITNELQEVVEKYKTMPNVNIKEVKLPKNLGLGLALAEGIQHCSYEIVARMDTDDIAVSDRFEKQLNFLKSNNLDICGSHIKEFEQDPAHTIAVRKVPLTHAEILEYQKNRSAFNHMTIMYKKSSVISAGNYKDCPLMEDDMLWVEMIQSGAKCGNIDDYLVYARTNSSMIERRGGLAYYKKYKTGRKRIYKTGYISWWDYTKTCMIQFVVCMMPAKLRRFVFFKLLHKENEATT